MPEFYPKALQYKNRKAPPAAKGKDSLIPSKQSGSVRKKTGMGGHGMTNQGGDTATLSAASRSDGLPMKDDHMEESMTGGPPGKSAAAGPNHGKAFHKKYDVAALSQEIRKRAKLSDVGSG